MIFSSGGRIYVQSGSVVDNLIVGSNANVGVNSVTINNLSMGYLVGVSINYAIINGGHLTGYGASYGGYPQDQNFNSSLVKELAVDSYGHEIINGGNSYNSEVKNDGSQAIGNKGVSYNTTVTNETQIV